MSHSKTDPTQSALQGVNTQLFLPCVNIYIRILKKKCNHFSVAPFWLQYHILEIHHDLIINSDHFQCDRSIRGSRIVSKSKRTCAQSLHTEAYIYSQRSLINKSKTRVSSTRWAVGCQDSRVKTQHSDRRQATQSRIWGSRKQIIFLIKTTTGRPIKV